jgi:hypothetical protein
VSTADITAPVIDLVTIDPPPMTRPERMVVRRIEPRSVLRLSVLFYLCVCGVLLVSAIVLWIGASLTGVLDNVESFFRDAGFDGFRFSPFPLFRAFFLMGVILTAAGTAANVLLAALYNVLADAVGGVRITVAEDGDLEPER